MACRLLHVFPLDIWFTTRSAVPRGPAAVSGRRGCRPKSALGVLKPVSIQSSYSNTGDELPREVLHCVASGPPSVSRALRSSLSFSIRQGQLHRTRIGRMTWISPKQRPTYHHDVADRWAGVRVCRLGSHGQFVCSRRRSRATSRMVASSHRESSTAGSSRIRDGTMTSCERRSERTLVTMGSVGAYRRFRWSAPPDDPR